MFVTRALLVLGATASVNALTAAANAQASANAEAYIDITIQAATCANCHGPNGRSEGGIPTIAGRPESVLLEQLNAFRSPTPPAHTTIMNRLAGGYSDAEIAALARHFSKVPTNTKAEN